MRSTIVFRARVLSVLLILVALLLVVRLYFVQIVHGIYYSEDAMGQYVEPDTESFDRGTIYFTTKDGVTVAAAITETGWRIAINPHTLRDASGAYQKLNAITPVDQNTFTAGAARSTLSYVEVADHIDDTAAKKIRALNIPGVMLVQDRWRAYPAGALAAQAIGFLGYEGTSTERTGQYGLERYYNDTLADPNSGLYVNPFAEIFSNMEDIVATDPTARQGSIVTSIEPNVQSALEKEMDAVMEEYQPEFVGGIIMDPHTGAIYAIGGEPSYDPNAYGSVDNPIVYQDKEVQGRYELGSIMKPLTMAIGIDSGAITASSTYDDTGCTTVSKATFCNYDLKARGVIPMQQILSESLNVGAAWVATKTGYPTFTTYMRALQFDQKTGIDLPGEVAGDLRNLGDGHGPAINYDTAAFGQGISVTPIEMIRALSVLANKGVLPTPHVVTAIKYESGVSRTIAVPAGEQVIKPATAQSVTSMLETVFDDALGKGKFKDAHYTFAAKTGTAQIPMPGGGYYPGDTYLHSFFGYFPANNPRFIIFLFAWKPHGQEYASATLAQPFVDISRYLINYYNIPPDR